MWSYVIASICCLFAGLCYAEFASMVPKAGSAYAYASVTMGELMGWILGWDITLEYAVAGASVARLVTPVINQFIFHVCVNE